MACFEHGSENLALAIAFINGSSASSVLCSGRKTFLDLLQLARKWGKPVQGCYRKQRRDCCSMRKATVLSGNTGF